MWEQGARLQGRGIVYSGTKWLSCTADFALRREQRVLSDAETKRSNTCGSGSTKLVKSAVHTAQDECYSQDGMGSHEGIGGCLFPFPLGAPGSLALGARSAPLGGGFCYVRPLGPVFGCTRVPPAPVRVPRHTVARELTGRGRVSARRAIRLPSGVP